MEKPQLINFIAKVLEDSGFKVYKNFKTSQRVIDIYAVLPTTIGDFGVVMACNNYDKEFEVGIDLLREMGMEDKPVYERFVFRSIKPEETDQLVNMEKACFPPNEACSEAFLRAIVEEAGDRCLAAVDRESGKIAGCLYGLTTNETIFNDTFLADISTHDSAGCNIMILGLEVLEAYRKQGLARELVFNYCRREQERGIRRLVLTCHPNKVKMYRKFGFRDLGESASKWGGGTWHEMDINLNW